MSTRGNDSSSGQAAPPSSLLTVLAPWESFPYFQNVNEQSFSITQNAAPVVVAPTDPMRISIIFSARSNNINLTTLNKPAAGTGIVLVAGSPLIIVNASLGNLSQVQWSASTIGITGTLDVILVAMKDWPSVGKQFTGE